MFKLKKVSCTRAFVCLLLMFTLLMGWTLAETAQEPAYMVQETVDAAAVEADVLARQEAQADPEIDIVSGIKKIALSTGFAQGEWRQYAMIAVACLLLYLAIVKQFEPLLLLPIAFGMLLANLPAAGMMAHPTYTFYNSLEKATVAASSRSARGNPPDV